MNFKEYLKESVSEANFKPVKFAMGDDMDTFGKYLTMYSNLSNAIKEQAIEDEWSSADYAAIKRLTVMPDAMRGAINLPNVFNECVKKDPDYCAVLHMATEDVEFMTNNTLEFNHISFQYSLVILKVQETYYFINLDEASAKIGKYMSWNKDTSMEISRALGRNNHSLLSFQSSIVNNGRDKTFKRIPDVEAWIPFL